MMGLTERELCPKTDTAGFNWYALTVKPQHETAVARGLQSRGVEPFTPCCRTARRWSDRVKVLDTPLFAGYVFCRFAASQRSAVMKTPGVFSLVAFGSQPAAIAEDEIERIRRMVASGLPLQPWPYLRAGDAVRIEAGPLQGLEGILVQNRGESRIVVSLSLLERSVSAVIDRALIAPIRTRN